MTVFGNTRVFVLPPFSRSNDMYGKDSLKTGLEKSCDKFSTVIGMPPLSVIRSRGLSSLFPSNGCPRLGRSNHDDIE